MKISPFFDSMLVKVSTHGNTLSDAAHKMLRALKEFRIRGVKNNIPFLENLVMHPEFISGNATVNLIAEHPELFTFSARQDRGTRMLEFLAEVTVNGNPDVKLKDRVVRSFEKPVLPERDLNTQYVPGTKDKLTELGAEAFCRWPPIPAGYPDADTRYAESSRSVFPGASPDLQHGGMGRRYF
jgi:pyruvate carboxylase